MEGSISIWTRRKMLQVGTGGLLAGALTACGPVRSTAPGPARQEAGELTWLIADHGGAAGQAWFEQTLIPAFTRERPKVQVTTIYVSWGELGQKRDTLYAAGTGPDLLQSGAGNAHAYRGLVIPLDDRLRRWKDWEDYYPATLATSRWQEKQYGIPARIDARAMIYRRDLFAQQGLELPTTWDEMRRAALALTRREGGELVQLGFDPVDFDGGFADQRWVPMLWQNGGEVVSPDGRRPLFNSPEGVEALRFWADLLNQVAPWGEKLPEVPSGLSRLAAGTAVANIAGQWILTGAIQNAPEVVEHLVVRPPLRQRRQLINVFNNWFGIGSQSKYMDLAWELLLHFNQPDNLLEYCRLVGSAVPRRSLRERGHMTDPRYQMKAWIEIVEQYARPHPLIVAPSVPVGGTGMWAVLTEAIHNVRQGKQGPKEALDEAARNWQLQLDAAYRELGL